MISTDDTALLTVLLAKHITSCDNVFLKGYFLRSVRPYLISEVTESKIISKNKNDIIGVVLLIPRTVAYLVCKMRPASNSFNSEKFRTT